MVESVVKRATIGVTVRGIVSALEAAGVCDEIRPKLSPEARRLIDSPPYHIAWIDDRLIDEIVYSAEALRGHDFVRDVGYAVTRDSSGPMLSPILRMIMAASGSAPSTLFSNLNRIVPMETRGLTTSYERVDDRSGVVVLTFAEKVPPCALAFWEGVLRFPFDLCNVKGEVGAAELSPDGMSARVKVKW